MNIWKTQVNLFWKGLLETKAVEKKRVEQVQCPHDLGGCGRFMDKTSGTYIDHQTKKRVRNPNKVGYVVGLGILIPGITALILTPLRSAAIHLLLSFLQIFILHNHNYTFNWSDAFVLLYLLFLTNIAHLTDHLIQKNGEEIRSQADRIETYQCPNPVCGLRSTFINGKPVRLK